VFGSTVSLRHFRRSYDLHQRLTILLVSAVATVLLTRSFLAAAGYPQVGGSKFHIAHVLYGGLLLTAACVAMLAFLNPGVKLAGAVLGGFGFGLFIDEVGKFVTKDVNYFYRPAIAIIYVCFIVLFGVIRELARRRFRPDEAVLIAIEALKQSAVHGLTAGRRAHVLGLLQTTGAAGPLADGVRALLDNTPTTSDSPGPMERLYAWGHRTWARLTSHPRFRDFVLAFVIVGGAVSGAELGWLVRNGLGALTFSQRAFGITTLVADLLLVGGMIRLPESLLGALRWYEHAVLLEIFVGQVFLYTSEQLAATLNLAGLLILWALIRWGIHFESAKHIASQPTPTAEPAVPSGG
jgi:hypothetical protein